MMWMDVQTYPKPDYYPHIIQDFHPYEDVNRWRIIKDIPVELSDGSIYVVKAGLSYDLASIPRWARWLYDKDGPYLIAAVVHDDMYIRNWLRDVMTDKEARTRIDYEFLYLSNKYNGYTKARVVHNHIRYGAIRIGGGRIFKK